MRATPRIKVVNLVGPRCMGSPGDDKLYAAVKSALDQFGDPVVTVDFRGVLYATPEFLRGSLVKLLIELGGGSEFGARVKIDCGPDEFDLLRLIDGELMGGVRTVARIQGLIDPCE